MLSRRRMGFGFLRAGAFALVAAVLAMAAPSPAAGAELVRVGELSFAPHDGRTPGITGVAFDGQANPVVLDRLAWTLARVDLANGAANVGTARPTPLGNSSMGGLAFQAATGNYFSVGIGSAPFLARIDPSANTVTRLTGNLGVTPTFASLAFDPAGTLWLLSSDNLGELWTVDPATGRGTKRTAIHFPTYSPARFSGAISALAINDRNQFVVAATLGDGTERLFRVDPTNGNTTLLGETGLSALSDFGVPARLDALAYEPATGRYYGVENRSGGYYLDEVRGVPEPAAACAVLSTCVLLLRRRRGST